MKVPKNLFKELNAWVGSGKKYDSEKRVWTGSEEHFGFVPYPGTLNVAIRPVLGVSDKDVTIQPFEDFVCYEGRYNGELIWLCYSKYRNTDDISTFYVVSEHRLRDKYDLQDKQKIKIRIKKEMN